MTGEKTWGEEEREREGGEERERENRHGSGRMGTQTCRGGEEAVFEPASVFSVELSGGADKACRWHLSLFQCCCRLSCFPGRLEGRGGEGWIVLAFGIGGWHGDGVGVFICLHCHSSDLTVTDFSFWRLGVCVCVSKVRLQAAAASGAVSFLGLTSLLCLYVAERERGKV